MSYESPLSEVLEGPIRVIRNAWKYLLALGVVAAVLGVVVLAWPGQTLLVLGALFGSYLLVSGIVSIVGAFGRGVPGGLRVLGIISGGVSLILGAMAFRGPLQSVLLLSIWIGVSWLIGGINRAAIGFAIPSGVPGRGWSIFAGILLIVGGIIIVMFPLDSIAQLALLAGIWLIIIGLAQVWDALKLHRHLEHVADQAATRTTA